MLLLKHGRIAARYYTWQRCYFEVSQGPPLGKSSAARGLSRHLGLLGILFLGWMRLVCVCVYVSLVLHEICDMCVCACACQMPRSIAFSTLAQLEESEHLFPQTWGPEKLKCYRIRTTYQQHVGTSCPYVTNYMQSKYIHALFLCLSTVRIAHTYVLSKVSKCTFF